MSAVILDAGAFVATERDDRATIARLRVAQREGLELRTTGAVVAQVWRDSSGRQANLARLLKSVDVRPVDERLGRDAGELLGKAGSSDAVDASVVAISVTGDRIMTSDAGDTSPLVSAAEQSVLVVPC